MSDRDALEQVLMEAVKRGLSDTWTVGTSWASGTSWAGGCDSIEILISNNNRIVGRSDPYSRDHISPYTIVSINPNESRFVCISHRIIGFCTKIDLAHPDSLDQITQQMRAIALFGQ
jgi:hypothetical protein